MTEEQAFAAITKVLARIAPEVQADELKPSTVLQEDLDLDSMDFLNLVTGVADATGVDVPERDYPRLATLGGFAKYVADAPVAAAPPA
jgi:acyl carrier protein